MWLLLFRILPIDPIFARGDGRLVVLGCTVVEVLTQISLIYGAGSFLFCERGKVMLVSDKGLMVGEGRSCQRDASLLNVVRVLEADM